MNSIQTTPAVCELELKSGHLCAVTAIGRCSVCERAYCSTHQAERYTHVPFVHYVVEHVSMCVTCAAAMDVKLSEPEKRKYEAQQYMTSGAARNALLAAKVPSIEIFSIEQKLKQGFFRSSWVNTVTPWQHAWILGEFTWSGTRTVHGSDSLEASSTNYFTALLNLSSDPGHVVPVQRYGRSYAFDVSDGGLHPPPWLTLVEAVERLIETPNSQLQPVAEPSGSLEARKLEKQKQITRSSPPWSLVLFLHLAWAFSWITWFVLMYTNGNSIGEILMLRWGDYIPQQSWTILLSCILLFFCWSWLAAQTLNGLEADDAVYYHALIGIILLTWTCSGCMFANMANVPFGIGSLIVGVVFPGLLLCVFTVPAGIAFAALGVWIGRKLRPHVMAIP